MTDLELIFTMLGEAATTEVARNKDAQGAPKNKRAARARHQLQSKSGRKVVTGKIYLIGEPKPKLITK